MTTEPKDLDGIPNPDETPPLRMSVADQIKAAIDGARSVVKTMADGYPSVFLGDTDDIFAAVWPIVEPLVAELRQARAENDNLREQANAVPGLQATILDLDTRRAEFTPQLHGVPVGADWEKERAAYIAAWNSKCADLAAESERLTAALAEVQRLTAENESLRDSFKPLSDQRDDLLDIEEQLRVDLDRLTAENEALRRTIEEAKKLPDELDAIENDWKYRGDPTSAAYRDAAQRLRVVLDQTSAARTNGNAPHTSD